MAEAPQDTPSPQLVISCAEPVTVFHFEVLTVNDSQVAKLTTQLMYVSFCLVIVAIVNFVIDLGRSSLTISSAIINLLVALSLPACGFIGVKDKNITCIQYFCCCTYLCAFLTFISMISAVVLLANGKGGYASQLVLFALFFLVYLKGGGLSQRLQEQPYFTQDRLQPRNSVNIHENTVECNPQPTAHAEFVETAPVIQGTAIPAMASMPAGPNAMIPHSVVVVGGSGVYHGGEGGGTGGGSGSGGGGGALGGWFLGGSRGAAETSPTSSSASVDAAAAAAAAAGRCGGGSSGIVAAVVVADGQASQQQSGGGSVPMATAVAILPVSDTAAQAAVSSPPNSPGPGPGGVRSLSSYRSNMTRSNSIELSPAPRT